MGSCTFEEKKKGDGQTFPKNGQRVVIQYEGRLQNGQVFDSTSWRNNNFSFRVGKGEVIRGLDENVKKMSIGSVIELTCPPEFAYGKMGYPGVIPQNATLSFTVELVSIDS